MSVADFAWRLAGATLLLCAATTGLAGLFRLRGTGDGATEADIVLLAASAALSCLGVLFLTTGWRRRRRDARRTALRAEPWSEPDPTPSAQTIHNARATLASFLIDRARHAPRRPHETIRRPDAGHPSQEKTT